MPAFAGQVRGRELASLDSVRFLIVDDNQYMRAIVVELLRAFGAKRILEAVDGAEAISKGESWEPDIVIIDYAMATDGLTFTRKLRAGQTKLDPTLPVILMTGHTEASRVEAARDAGVTEFLAKPLSAETLFARIAAVIDKPRAFTKGPNYIGPCRRRRLGLNFTPWRRRATDPAQEGASWNANGDHG
jgi:CheY-like chemotaxis protein